MPRHLLKFTRGYLHDRHPDQNRFSLRGVILAGIRLTQQGLKDAVGTVNALTGGGKFFAHKIGWARSNGERRDPARVKFPRTRLPQDRAVSREQGGVMGVSKREYNEVLPELAEVA